MASLTAFEWSVGLSAWLSLAAVTLVYTTTPGGPRPGVLGVAVGVTSPLIAVGVLYIAASLFLAFLRSVLFVLCAMMRGEVLLGAMVCACLTIGLRALLTLRETAATNPDALSPATRASLRQCELFVSLAYDAVGRGYAMARVLIARSMGTGDLEYFLRMLACCDTTPTKVPLVATPNGPCQATSGQATSGQATPEPDITLSAMAASAFPVEEEVAPRSKED